MEIAAYIGYVLFIGLVFSIPVAAAIILEWRDDANNNPKGWQ